MEWVPPELREMRNRDNHSHLVNNGVLTSVPLYSVPLYSHTLNGSKGVTEGQERQLQPEWASVESALSV